jgi:hypothetical protein
MVYDWPSYKGNLDWLPVNTIYLTLHGSQAYGLATDTSDYDYKGIAIPTREYFLGFLKRFEQAESKTPDCAIYDIRKFFQLAADCNPNIIEVLYTDESDIAQIKEDGRRLRDIRQMFLSRKAKHTFSGYAIAQLKRIRTHRKWLLHPIEIKPERKDFGLPDTSLLSADLMGAVEAVVNKSEATENVGMAEFGSNVMEVYQKERTYHNALREWQQYQNWKTTRNPQRAELERKYSIDTKHAMHLVRLLKMCREILERGEVIVKRPDRDELLAIRNGAWSYDKIVGWAEDQDAEMNELMATSLLPHACDRVALDKICVDIVSGWI